MYVTYDGDEILFKTCVVVKKDICLPGMETEYTDPDAIHRMVEATVEEVTEVFGPHKPVFSFSSEDNFRKDLADFYKANREGKEKPHGYWDAKAQIVEHYQTDERRWLEADDVMGIAGGHVVSSDKDMKTVPGLMVYSLYHKESYETTELSANFNWMQQTLMGDNSDNYKGCPGIGKARSERILSPCRDNLQDMWFEVYSNFTAKGLTYEDALVQARLARILRFDDTHVDRDGTRVIKLWPFDREEALNYPLISKAG